MSNKSNQNSKKQESEEKTDFEVKFKTEICRNFELKGVCKFGDKCWFAHGEQELRNKKHINLHYKSKKCGTFFETGYCPYGSRWQYLHKEEDYTHIFHSYWEKILVWMEKNPKLDMNSIMQKTHPFCERIEFFVNLTENKDHQYQNLMVAAN